MIQVSEPVNGYVVEVVEAGLDRLRRDQCHGLRLRGLGTVQLAHDTAWRMTTARFILRVVATPGPLDMSDFDAARSAATLDFECASSRKVPGHPTKRSPMRCNSSSLPA